MEVKINREIRQYTESMFFGLSARQFFFSLMAVGVAVGLYFFLKPRFGTETVSWMCILGAAPFAAMGFVTWHGMTAEKFLWAWIRDQLLEPRRLCYKPNNLYYELLKEASQTKGKEGKNQHAEINCTGPEAGPGKVPGAQKSAGSDPRQKNMARRHLSGRK